MGLVSTLTRLRLRVANRFFFPGGSKNFYGIQVVSEGNVLCSRSQIFGQHCCSVHDVNRPMDNLVSTSRTGEACKSVSSISWFGVSFHFALETQ